MPNENPQTGGFGLAAAKNQELWLAGQPRICASLGRVSGANSALNDGVNLQVLTRSVHQTGRFPVQQLQIGVANFKVNGTTPFGEQPNGGVATYSVALEYADGTVIQGLFKGQQSIDLPANSGIVYSDPIADVPANTEIFVRTWVRVAATNIALAAAQTVSSGLVTGKQIARKGTDLSAQFLTAGQPTGTTSTQIPPVSLIGIVKGGLSVVYGTSSIGDGTGDVATDLPHGETSFVGRALQGLNGFDIPHCKISRGGELDAALAANSTGWRRKSLFQYGNVFIDEGGTNDIVSGNGFTLQQIQTNYINLWKAAKDAGMIVIKTGILPRVSGITAGVVTTQVPFVNFEPNGTSLRDVLHAWFPTMVGSYIDKYVPVHQEVEGLGSNRGLWATPGTPGDTDDGVHPAQATHIRMSNWLRQVLLELDQGA